MSSHGRRKDFVTRRRFVYSKCIPQRLLQTSGLQSYHETQFSNFLMIYEYKAREITTVKEVWKYVLNSHEIWGSFALNFAKF